MRQGPLSPLIGSAPEAPNRAESSELETGEVRVTISSPHTKQSGLTPGASPIGHRIISDVFNTFPLFGDCSRTFFSLTKETVFAPGHLFVERRLIVRVTRTD